MANKKPLSKIKLPINNTVQTFDVKDNTLVGSSNITITTNADNTRTINIPSTATPSVASLTTSGNITVGGTISEGGTYLQNKYLLDNQVATVETTTVASNNYVEGNLLIYDGVLYKVINDISLGENIVIGTNVMATTTEELFNNKQNALKVKGYGSIDQKKWSGIVYMHGYYIWTDGEDIYYSYNTTQYVLDKTTLTWSIKTWSGLTNFNGLSVWTDGENIYYSNGSSQYVLDKLTSTWTDKTWLGLTTFYGHNIWTDGENIYYSQGSAKYVLDKTTSTWSTKTWTGLSNMSGAKTWTDGENIYYSDGRTQKVLNKSTSTWTDKTWLGLTSFNGSDVWTDGKDTYYSNNSDQYVLNKSASAWSTKTWTGLNNMSGEYVWTDGEDIYYSCNTTQKILNKKTSTWIDKNWVGAPFGADRNCIWTDGENVYYSYNSDQYVLDKATSTWFTKTWSGLTNFNGEYVWTDGDDIYYSYGSDQYVLNKSASAWSTKTWTGLNPAGKFIWTDGENIYCSQYYNHYVLDKSTSTWSTKTWINFTGEVNTGKVFWTDGDNIYCSRSSSQLVLDKSTSTWSTKTWLGLTNFWGQYIWKDGEDIYYSDNSSQYVLDKPTSTWSTKTWSGLTNLRGSNIWTSENHIYSSYTYNQSELFTTKDLSLTVSKVVETGDFNDLTNRPITYNKDEINSFLDEKQNTLISGTNIKTINSQTILGSGNIVIGADVKTLKTNNNNSLAVSSGETLGGTGTINLHRISKTGDYNHLINRPNIPTWEIPKRLFGDVRICVNHGNLYLDSSVLYIGGDYNDVQEEFDNGDFGIEDTDWNNYGSGDFRVYKDGDDNYWLYPYEDLSEIYESCAVVEFRYCFYKNGEIAGVAFLEFVQDEDTYTRYWQRSSQIYLKCSLNQDPVNFLTKTYEAIFIGLGHNGLDNSTEWCVVPAVKTIKITTDTGTVSYVNVETLFDSVCLTEVFKKGDTYIGGE